MRGGKTHTLVGGAAVIHHGVHGAGQHLAQDGHAVVVVEGDDRPWDVTGGNSNPNGPNLREGGWRYVERPMVWGTGNLGQRFGKNASQQRGDKWG